MKSKTLFQVLTLIALTFSVLGVSQPVQARSDLVPAAEPVIVSYNMTAWNATYYGAVSASRYEQWTFSLTETTSFIVTAAITSGDLVPLITLSGNGVVGIPAPATGTINATLPPGNYSILIQPQSGSGTYSFTLRVAPPAENVSAVVSIAPASVMVGESAVATVSLANVPATGLTSAEFNCSYDPAFVEVSGVADAGLFGADAVMVVNGPANGVFIVALAGSNGKRATTSGAVFTFDVKTLKVGDVSIGCSVRVSKGDQALTSVNSTQGALKILPLQGVLAGKVTASKPVTIRIYDQSNSMLESIAAEADGSFNISLLTGTYTVIASADGFLKAQASATITAGGTTTLSNVKLLAGDIDGNDVIDQYDAMTVGMSYNTATPAAADLNNDGTINVLDLELLAANYRKSGALAWQ
jgi:hypothetical protein